MSPETPTTLMIAAREPSQTSALTQMVQLLRPELRIVAYDAHPASGDAREPSITLVVERLEDFGELAAAVRGRHASTQIVLIAPRFDARAVDAAARVGAAAVLPSPCEPAALLEALQKRERKVVHAGRCSGVETGELLALHGKAKSKGIAFICLNPMKKESYTAAMAPFKETGFDDIIILAPVTPVIADAATYLAPKGVMNIFAGVPRGKYAEIDLSDAYRKQARVIGHSASTIENMRFMLDQAETGHLSPNRSVAAIGSLEAAYDGLKAVDETRFPGKIIIYPHIKPLPLTALADLKDVLPTVYAKLKDGREWTTEAEAELLRVMLP